MVSLAFLLLSLLLSCHVVIASRITRASFIPPASPRITSSTAPSSTVANSYGLCTDSTLFAKKKTAAVSAPKKVQVKLLKHVAGIGQAGEVIMVTPAFFNNKLRPTKSAEMITDDEVKKQQSETQARQASVDAAAHAVVENLDSLVLSIQRKCGPDGQLFGGIGPKCIMDELSKTLPSDLWTEKSVRITAVMDAEGNAMKADIKHVGKFRATICLTKDIVGKVEIDVVAEQ